MFMIHAEKIAKEKLNTPHEWEVFKYERIGDGDDTLVTGGIPRLLKSGKRKGRKTWRDCEVKTCVIVKLEVKAEIARYEKETGKCSECMGEKEVFKSWNAETGVVNRTCPRCTGTGLAP